MTAGLVRRTIDVHKSRSMTDEAFRDFEKVVHADAQTYLLDDLCEVISMGG